MRKSFTRLLSLVMLLGFVCFSGYAGAAPSEWDIPTTVLGTGVTKVLPVGATAYTKTTDKAMVIYSENVVASTGSIRITNANGLVRVIPATDPRVSFAKGDTVVIDLSADLKELTKYAVSVDLDAFKAADGTPASYTGSSTTWGWQTGDYTGPTLKSVVPVAGTVIKPSDGTNANAISLEMTFEDASSVLLGTGNVALYKADGNVWDLVNVTSGTMTGTGTSLNPYKLTLTGIRTLEDNVEYAVTIGAGAVTDDGKRADAKKNSFAGLSDRTVWTFSTKDFSAPVFATDYPKKGAVTNNSAAVLIKTTEPGTAFAVITTTSTVTVSDIPNYQYKKSVEIAAAGTEYSINFTQIDGVNLAGNTPYYIHVVTKNADGVVGTEPPAVAVKTTEIVSPVLTGVTYFKGSTYSSTATVASNVVTSATIKQDIDNIVLTFFDDNTGLKLGAGNVIIRKAVDNSIFATIPVTSLTVVSNTTASAQTVKIPVSGFANNTKYYVTIPNTLILDKFDNKYAGISSTIAWAFTTDDVVGPTFTYTPIEGASNVDRDAKIVLTFNERIYAASGYDLTAAFSASSPANPFEVKVDGTAVAFGVTESTNDGKFSTFTIDPTADFGSGAVVTVYIKQNSLKDVGGNVVDPQGQGINFVVEDYVSPVLTWKKTPADPSDAAVAEFDESIYLAGGGEITNANLFSILTVKKYQDNSNVPYTATIDENKKVISITPSSPWSSETRYIISISSAIEDASGNGYTGATASRTNDFTINDVTAATVDLSSVDGKTLSTSVGTSGIVLSFKEGSNVEPRTDLYYNGGWQGSYSAANMSKVIIFKEGSASGPDVPFTVAEITNGTYSITATLDPDHAKTYYIGVGASTKGGQGAGTVNVAKFVTFNTKFEGVPSITSLSPADDAVEVSKSSDFLITFDTNVEKVGGAIGTNSIVFTDGATTIPVINSEVTITNNVVKINPTNDLSNDKSYDILIAAGVFKNVNSSAVNTQVALDAWDFKTKDTKVVVNSLKPDYVDGSTYANIDDKLEIGFGEKVVKGIGYIDIKKSNSDALVERIDVVSSKVVLSDDQKKVTITPTSLFSYNTEYYIEVSAGAIKDLVGNSIDAIDGKTASTTLTEWTFKTSNPALVIEKVTPKDGADKVASDASIVVEFNREIAAVSGEVGYIEYNSSVSPATTQTQSFAIGSSNISISGKTLTITHPNKTFPANSEIFLYLPADVLKASTDANLKNGLYDMTHYVATTKVTSPISFYTGDVNAPVPTFNPAQFDSNDPVYTPVTSNITVTFDEDIFNADGTTIDNGDLASIFKLTEGTSTIVNYVGTISGKTVTLVPTSPMAEFTQYTISVLGNMMEDSKGTTLTPTASSSFKTVDKTAPVISPFTLGGGAKLVTIPTVTINDAALNNNKFYYLLRVKSTDAAPTVAEIKAANAVALTGNTFTSTVIDKLTASTTYQLFYIADDDFGNTTEVAVVEASTDDTIAPLLVSTNPAAGAVDVNVATGGAIEVKLTFNENVHAGTSTAAVNVYDFNTQSLFATTSTITAVSGDSKSVKLIISGFPTNDPATKLYIEIPSGKIVDASNNPYAGAFGTSTIYFTTEDNEVPTVDVAESTNGDVDLDTNIDIVFSEDVKAGNGTVVLYKGSISNTNAIQVFTANEATFNGKKATVNPTANLEVGTVYYVVVNAGFAKDLSTNANLSDAGTVSFTGSSNVRPSVIKVIPAGGATAIAKSLLQNIEVVFSENIYLAVAGYSKPLPLMTQAELLAHVSLKDASGASVVINQINKTTEDILVGSSTVTYTSLTIVSPATSFKHQSSYTLTVSGFEDIDGLVMDDKVVNYKTTDGIAPVLAFNPANDAKNVIPSSPLTITFNEQVYRSVVVVNDKLFYQPIDNSNVKALVYLQKGGVDVPFTATFNGVDLITLTPNEALESSAVYVYGLVTGNASTATATISDKDGNVVSGGDPKTTASFTVADVVAPKLAAAPSFAPNSTGTSKSASMWVKFNEEVVVSTGSIVIRREDGTVFQTVSSAGLSIDSSDKTKLKIAHNDFEPYTNYFVEISASTVVDKSGNPNALFNDPTPEKGWLFTTADTYALTATVTPSGDNTPRSVSLEINFNKVPAGVADKYVAVYKADGTAVYQFAATDAVVAGKTALFSNVALDADQAYYARIEAGAFKDQVTPTNVFAGIMDNSWAFSTIDNIAPKVVTLAPADNASSVDTQTSSLVITFDRNIALGTGMIAVRHTDGSLFEEINVANTVVNAKTLTINLTKALESNTGYYVIVPAAAVINTEITKDAFAGILNTYTWNFTTSTDQTAPKLVTWTPNATTIADNHPAFTMVFDENVVLGAGNLKVYKAADGSLALTIPVTASMVTGKTVSVTYTFDATLKNGLDKNTDYYVLVDAGVVKDAAANAFAGVTATTTWSFKTGKDFATDTDPVIDNSLEFKVYPNPFVDYVIVDNASELTKVVITNIAGQVVKEVVTPDSRIQLNELRSGVYFISLYKGNTVAKTVKIAKR